LGANQSLARLLLLALAASALPLCPWQPELPRDLLLLRDIKAKMSRNLARVPNYTCLETVFRGAHASDRMVIAVPGKEVPFRRIDVLRLEVAEVAGDELYAHAGEHNFEKRDITEYGNGGLMGNGTFTLFARNVFATNQPTYKFAGEEDVAGRKLVRFNYNIPQMISGYRVGTNFGAAIVGYHGSFWADPTTFDAARLTIVADDIPHFVGLATAESRIDFAKVRIGDSDVLLPQSGELSTTQLKGSASRNEIAFTHCREYGVATTIRFDDITESDGDGELGPSGTNYVELPSGMELTLKLETAIDASTSHIGDVIAATVDSDSRQKNKVIVPKDAVVTGRLRRLELHKEGWPYVLAGLEFIQIEFEGKQTRFFAELEKLMLPPGTEGPKRVEAKDLPGVGMVTAMGNKLRLPEGTRMVWKTISYKQAAEIGKER
jgi:hypothetical protein